jgi:predicted O-methyltransferase YrrM
LDTDAIAPALNTEGATSPEELFHLFALAQCVRDGCIVEVGSWRGRSTVALALGSRRAYKVPVYAVEPHENFHDICGGNYGSTDRVKFFENMLKAGVLDIVRLVNLSSEFVTGSWPMSIGLLWIDGDHSYRAVKRDITCWLPHLRPDATVAFHDALEPRLGPYHVVEELMRSGQWQRGPEVRKIKTLVRMPQDTIEMG